MIAWGHMRPIIRWTLLVLWVGGIAGLAGCEAEQPAIETRYGSRQMPEPASINGTRVLAEMFREAGFTVSSHDRVSPRTLRSNVVIWFPGDAIGPDGPLREAITTWMEDEPYRTFVFVGFDFDAELTYWESVLDRVPPSQRWDAYRARARAQLRSDVRPRYGSGTKDYEWFRFHGDTPPRRVTTLAGPWADGIDADRTDIRLWSRMEVSGTTGRDGVRRTDEGLKIETLLSGDDDEPIVVRLADEFWDNQIILINNASFLLNLSLVNHEHRQLAARLIEATGENGAGSVSFLETTYQPSVVHEDAGGGGTSGWEWLSQWPLRLIGLQLAIALIMLCFALFPIFGRPKQLPEGNSSDFKKHIDALGALLEASGDHGYAQLRVKQYHQLVKGDTVYRRSHGRKG